MDHPSQTDLRKTKMDWQSTLGPSPFFHIFFDCHHTLYGQRAEPPLAARPWNSVHIIVIPYTWLSLLEFLILIGLLNKPGNFNTYAQFWKRSQRHLAWIKITSYVEGRYVGLLKPFIAQSHGDRFVGSSSHFSDSNVRTVKKMQDETEGAVRTLSSRASKWAPTWHSSPITPKIPFWPASGSGLD